MEVDTQSPSSSVLKQKEFCKPQTSAVMASAGTQGSVTVAVHPLVVMNISEHWTRVKAQNGSPRQVYGALIGKLKGRNLEIMNSFELVTQDIDNSTIVDKDYLRLREGQYKEVFKDLEFLGWYTTGDCPTESDVVVNRQISEVNESPVLLKLNPQTNHHDNLPIAVFESVIDLVDGQAKMLFIQLSYTLATEEAERIGVDHVARLSKVEVNETSTVSDHLLGQSGAVKMLHSRAMLVLEYVKAVSSGELPKNDEILREISSLCSRLPVANSDKFHSEFFDQCNDVALITYIGVLTKMCSPLNQVVNKHNVVYEKGGGQSRRVKGMFF